MNFELSEEHLAVRDAARDFAMINQKKSFLQRRFSSSILNSDEILNKIEEKVMLSKFGL